MRRVVAEVGVRQVEVRVFVGLAAFRIAIRVGVQPQVVVLEDVLRFTLGVDHRQVHVLAEGGRVTQHEFVRVRRLRSAEHTSELQSLMRISYAVFCLKKKQISDSTTATTTGAN